MWRLASNKTQFRSTLFWGLAVVLLTGTTLVSAEDQSAGERYAKILADSESLARYNEQLTSQLDAQQSQVLMVEQQLTEIDATAAQIVPLIQKMFESLETFMAADLPFLDPTQAGPDSRQERLLRIRDLMAKPDATNAERYRRLLEAYQIELDYGRTMISYKGKLTDGREADFVRVGRVSLLYRTADGEESGYWDAQQKKWVVANEYNKAVENAVLIATKETAPDLVTVPVPAPQEVPL
jgi:Protein of unknown function (DUF3450)